MNILRIIKSFPFFKTKKRVIITILMLLVIGFLWFQNSKNKNAQPKYQTAQVTRGTFVVSLTESGQVAVTNRMNVVTQASGVVQEVYVKNGDSVTQGEKIASITLDQVGQLRQTLANTSYLSAQSNLAQANANMFTLQGTMFSDWNTFYVFATNSTYQNPDGSPNTANRALPQFTTAQDAWLAAQANYKNQQTVVYQAQSNLSNSLLNLSETSDLITAPSAGIIADLTLAPGMQITNTATASNSTGSSNTGNTVNGSTTNIASIKIDGKPVITVNLSEIDATQVQSGQHATVTFDSLPNITFTGLVLGVNTTGVVNSGVTTYPATIVLDTGSTKILPNMSASASIITNVKDNVLLVPVAAVQTSNGQSMVRVFKNGAVTSTPVEVGLSSDSELEIISGVSEGETVVTGSTTSTATGAGIASPFGGAGLGGFRGGGFGGGRGAATGR